MYIHIHNGLISVNYRITEDGEIASSIETRETPMEGLASDLQLGKLLDFGRLPGRRWPDRKMLGPGYLKNSVYK